MANVSTCPDPRTLEDLLANRLSAVDADSVRAHVGSCARCQEQLGLKPAGPPPSTLPRPTPAPAPAPAASSPAAYPFLNPPRGPNELGWLGEYRVLGVLGQGGMSIVFDAEEPLLSRKLALKVLRPQIAADSVMRERFLREAKALASLPAAHVVHVYSVGEDKGVPYLAMERLQGESLAARLKRDKYLPVVDALRIAREAAEGLAVLHQRDLVHRDIKPDNLWLENGTDGRFKSVKLIDFGIARMVTGDSGLTRPGQVIGTPVYMAPEQAAGQPVDGRTDLYSLGCVLYRMVTGYTPFDNAAPAETMALLEAVIKGDAPKVSQVAPNLSTGVAELIQQLMSRQPEKRPPSAEQVAHRLRQLEHEERTSTGKTVLIQAAAAGSRRRTARRAGPLGLILGGLAIVAALLVGALAVYSQFWVQTTKSKFTGPPLKVGVLFSHTAHELPIIDAIQLAVEEINQSNESSGVLGREIELVIENGASDEKTYAERAQKLIDEDEVAVIFGCATSSARRRVAEVCQKSNRLLFYPGSDESLDESPNVIYLGGTPNQTIPLLIEFAMKSLHRSKFFLVGSANISSRAVNDMLVAEIKNQKGEVVNKPSGVVLSESNLASVVKQIKDSKVDFVINSIDATNRASNLAFFNALRQAKISPREKPMAWLGISELDLADFRSPEIADDYSVACYFESLTLPANKAFLERFRKGSASPKRVNDIMQTAYAGVHLWKAAVVKANSLETDAVRRALRGLNVETPAGPMRIDRGNLHAWRTPRVGKVEREDNGRLNFQIVSPGAGLVKPVPFPELKTPDEWKAFLKQFGGPR